MIHERPGADSSIERLRVLYRFMSRQQFVGGRSEIRALGFSSSTIASWIRTGRVVPIFQGVYAYGRDIETIEAAWKAALIFGGPGSALTGPSACEAWGIRNKPIRMPKEIHIVRPAGRSARHKGRSPATRLTEIRSHQRVLLPGDICSLQGIDLIKPSLAIADLAVTASKRTVLFAFLEACRLRLFGQGDVDFCFRRSSGRRGMKKLNPLLASWIPELEQIRSVLEGLFLLAWLRTGRPMPLVNVRVAGFEVDMYWPEFDLILELDGSSYHGDPIASARDLAKTRQLEENEKTVLRASFDEVDSHPTRVTDMVIREMEANCRN